MAQQKKSVVLIMTGSCIVMILFWYFSLQFLVFQFAIFLLTAKNKTSILYLMNKYNKYKEYNN